MPEQLAQQRHGVKGLRGGETGFPRQHELLQLLSVNRLEDLPGAVIPALAIRSVLTREHLGQGNGRRRVRESEGRELRQNRFQGLRVGAWVANLGIAGQEDALGPPEHLEAGHDKAVFLKGSPAFAFHRPPMKAEAAVVAETRAPRGKLGAHMGEKPAKVGFAQGHKHIGLANPRHFEVTAAAGPVVVRALALPAQPSQGRQARQRRFHPN